MGNALGCFRSRDTGTPAGGATAKPTVAKKDGLADKAKSAAAGGAASAKAGAAKASDAAASGVGAAGDATTKAKAAVLGGAPVAVDAETPAEADAVVPVVTAAEDEVVVAAGEKAAEAPVPVEKAAEGEPVAVDGDAAVEAAPEVASTEPLLPVTTEASAAAVPVEAVGAAGVAGAATVAAVAVPTEAAEAEIAIPSASTDDLVEEGARSPSPDTIVPKAPEFKAVGLEEAGAKIADAPEDTIPDTPVVDHHVPAPLPPRPVVLTAPVSEAKPEAPSAVAAALDTPTLTASSASSPTREALVTDPSSPPKDTAAEGDAADAGDPNRASYGGVGDVSASIKERQAAFSHPVETEEEAGTFGSRLKFGAVEKNDKARMEAARHRGMVFDVVSGEEITEAEYRRRLHLRGIVEENVNKYEELQKAEALQERELAIQKATLASRRKDQPGGAGSSPSSSALDVVTAPSEASMEPEALTPSVAAAPAVPPPVAEEPAVEEDVAQPPPSSTTVTSVLTADEGADPPIAA